MLNADPLQRVDNVKHVNKRTHVRSCISHERDYFHVASNLSKQCVALGLGLADKNNQNYVLATFITPIKDQWRQGGRLSWTRDAKCRTFGSLSQSN